MYKQPGPPTATAETYPDHPGWDCGPDKGVRQELEQIRIWVQPIGLCRFHQRVDNGAGFRILRGIREQPVFSSNCKGPDGVLGKIVGNTLIEPVDCVARDDDIFCGAKCIGNITSR